MVLVSSLADGHDDLDGLGVSGLGFVTELAAK
jgi:hypothetical protein